MNQTHKQFEITLGEHGNTCGVFQPCMFIFRFGCSGISYSSSDSSDWIQETWIYSRLQFMGSQRVGHDWVTSPLLWSLGASRAVETIRLWGSTCVLWLLWLGGPPREGELDFPFLLTLLFCWCLSVWLHQFFFAALRIFVASYGIFHCGPQTLRHGGILVPCVPCIAR